MKMMTQTSDDMSSTKTRLDETKARLHQRKAPSYSRLAEQISAESFQVDLNARSASQTTWLEERDQSTNPDMDMEVSTRFSNKLDSGLLEGGDADSSYWTRTSDEGSPVALASVEEDFHSPIRSLEMGTSEDSKILSEAPRKLNTPRGQAEHYSEEKGSEGHLAPSPMETDISSFFSGTKDTSGTSLGILSSRIQGLSPRQRLLYRYKLESLMSGSHNEEANGGTGLPDESPELSASSEHPMDDHLDGRSPCYIDALESSDSWQTSKSGGAEIEDLPVHAVPGILHDCHICNYVPFSRDDYDAHMKKTHFTHKCHLCIYWSRSPGRLNHHMKKFHSEPGDAPAIKKPKNPRKYTCKQCKYYTYVQEEIWNHTRLHVPASKLLSCPHCPFVCAFKHHMQYHMNNHMGYKPFKCSECNYRCNNKSMLNSHKKSHSNDYPFRCGVCNYAAKYRHALNIHLRKKKHVPDGEVLLEDGQRPTRTRNKANQGQRSRVQDVDFADEVGHGMSWAESQMNGMMDPVSIKEDPERMNISMNASFPHSQQPAYSLPGANMQPPLIPISELPFHLMNPSYSSGATTSGPMPTLTTAFAQSRSIPQLKSIAPPPHGASIPSYSAPQSHISEDHSTLYETSPPPGGVFSRRIPARTNYQTCYEGPEQEPMVQHRPARHYVPEAVQDFTNDSSAEEWPLDLTAKSKQGKSRATDCSQQSWQTSCDENPKSQQAKSQRSSHQLDWYECQHCGIIFPDQILYSMHMGYHNKSDPFQCNLCGQRTKDRRDFFSHISMVAHD